MSSIAYDHQVFGWQRYGGISRYIYELAKRVAHAEDFSASVIAPLYVNQYLKQGGIDIKGIRLPPVRRLERVLTRANRYLAVPLLKIANPDIVHETYYQRISSAPRGCPTVVTVHDMIHEKYSEYFKGDDTTEIKLAAVNRADRIICVSEQTRHDLIELLHPDPRKITTIHLGLTLSNTRSPISPAPKRPFFLYVGARVGYKNFETLLNAFATSRNLANEYDLVAFGGNSLSRQERDSIRRKGLEPARVRHLSGDDRLLGAYYRAATAFIFPSLYEGFGIPPLEAMGYGCPVLCSNTSSIPEVVGEAGVYFDPRDVDALRDAMERLASSAVLRSDLIARGHRRANAFSWQRCAEKSLDVYRDLLQ